MITINRIDYFEEADAKIIAYKLQYLVNPDVTPPTEYLKVVSAVEPSIIRAVHAYELFHTSDWNIHYKSYPKPYKGQWFVEVSFLRDEHWPDEVKEAKQNGKHVIEELGLIEDRLEHRRFCKIYTAPSTILDRWEKTPIKEVGALALKLVDAY